MKIKSSLFIFIFIIFYSNIFSKDIDIILKVISSDNKNISNALIKIDNKNYYSDNNGELKTNLTYGIYSIDIFSEYFKNYKKNIIIDGNSNYYEFYLQKQKENLKFIIKTSINEDLKFNDEVTIDNSDNSNIKSKVSFYKNNKNIKSIYIDNNKLIEMNIDSGKYDIKIETDSYKTLYKEDVDFSKNNSEFLIANIIKENTFISGRITSSSGRPIKEASITLKVNKKVKIVTTNSDGYYSANLDNGLLFIKIELDGFKSNGTITDISKTSYIDNLNFELEEILSSIEGTVTDGVKPIGGIDINLYNINDQLIASIITNQDGSYSMFDLPVYFKYYISIKNINYKNYFTNEFFLIRNDQKKINIILMKKSTSFILELSSKDGLPLINTKIYINNIQLETDINGIINSEIQIDLDKNIKITIPEYNYEEEFKIKNKNIDTLKKIIKI